MARSKMIMVRVDEAEHALFKEAARKVSISMSEYARDAMLARMALEEAPTPGEVRRVQVGRVEEARAAIVEVLPRVINKPADVPAAVERAARSANPAPRPFTPYSKEEQTGKAAKKTRPTVEVKSCRHGLLRCKVCGSG